MRNNKHLPFLIVLVLSFVMRLFLSDWNGYWFDELESIKFYGVDHATFSSMISALGETSVHPPLHPTILFGWMGLFGDTEFATRLLSNLYIAGSTVFLYLLFARYYSRRAAFYVVLMFSVSHTAISFGLEVRNYPQTLFFSLVAAYFLHRYLESDLSNRWLAYLSIANAAMLMTHYYNGVFVVAQAAFLFIYILKQRRRFDLLRPVSVVILPILGFMLVWGPQILHRLDNPISTPSIHKFDPITIFFDLIYRSVSVYPWMAPFMLGLWLFLLIEVVRALLRDDIRTRKDWLVVYVLSMFTLIPIGIYFMTGFGKYATRYGVYFVPYMFMLIVLVIEKAPVFLDRLFDTRLARLYLRHGWVLVAAVVLVVVLPFGYRAASFQKENYRGIASDIAAYIERHPQNRYLVYGAGGENSFIDFYFVRHDETLRTSGSLPRDREDEPSVTVTVSQAEDHDYLIVYFVHKNMSVYTGSLAYLCETYSYYTSDVIANKGTITFALNDDNADTCPDFFG